LKTLKEQDYIEASTESGIEVALIKTVAEVESAGGGFLENSDYPKILFEAHQFSKRTNHIYNETYPDISSLKWNRKLYIGGAMEYLRLAKAMVLNKQAALLSISLGKFQIMGFNFLAAGYDTVEDYVLDMFKSEFNHLMAFLNFIDSTNLKEPLINKDWDKFSFGYNGRGYKQNRYDEKLANAYAKYSKKVSQV